VSGGDDREEVTARLAEAEGLNLPADRLAEVTGALADLLALARSLEDLPLEGVEPVFGPQPWK
jgi:hypothetical protein